MATPNESRIPKRRLGRRRLPPLAPGSAFQFVVANHPDEFKADRTMRHVRSHVMYKHHDVRHERPQGENTDNRGRSSTFPGRSSTSSPSTASSDNVYQSTVGVSPPPTRNRSGTWDGGSRECVRYNCFLDPVRHLAHRIILATYTLPARSAPLFSEQSSEFPFWGSEPAEREALGDLGKQYISSTCFFSHGGWGRCESGGRC
jgi:hypothetical protein